MTGIKKDEGQTRTQITKTSRLLASCLLFDPLDSQAILL